MNYTIRNISALLILISIVTGCVSIQPFPNAAKSGETITLAVGSPEGMTKDNITVTFTSNDQVTYPGSTDITSGVKSVLKLYPDRTSYAWLVSTGTGQIARRSAHGPWLSVIIVDLPLGLPEGAGVINVTTDPGVTYPRFNPSADATDIDFTVLPGTGLPNLFEYVADGFGNTVNGNLGRLQPRPQAVVKFPVPDEGASSPIYGAIEVSVNLSMNDLNGGSILDEGIRVVKDMQPGNETSQVNQTWSRTEDDYTVMFVSPVGMHYYEARFSIVPLFPIYGYQITGIPTITSVAYYDLTGTLISGPASLPTISVE